MTFDKLVSELIEVEGGYVNNPDDSGGETRYGITKEVARSYGYTGSMKDLPIKIAKMIYKENYWNVHNLDDIYCISPRIAEELFDTGVNMSVYKAAEFFQISLNVLNQRKHIYNDLLVDRKIGPVTVAALKSHLEHRRDDTVLLRMLNCLQGAYYIDIATRREKDETFVYGWFLNRVVI